MIIKSIYTIFLAILIVLFVGLGIDAFYPAPQYPEYPTELDYKISPESETTEQEKIRMDYEQNQKKYEQESKAYSQNVSIISLLASIIILIISLTLLNKIEIIADGILLGGVLTIMYSVIRGVMTENSQFRFLIVTIGIVIAFILGYIKFIKPKKLN
jgi:Na+/H+ antiporter NhaC